MSVAVIPFRSLFAAPPIPLLRPALWAAFSAVLLPRPFALAIPTWQSLQSLFPPFLLAVPKKKVSHSRKAMRSANKGLKDKTNIVNCPACGNAKLAHHLCPNCYSELSREYKRAAREQGEL